MLNSLAHQKESVEHGAKLGGTFCCARGDQKAINFDPPRGYFFVLPSPSIDEFEFKDLHARK